MAKEPECWLGIDPGYGRLGWAVARPSRHPRHLQLLAAGCLETSARTSHLERLAQIQDHLQSIEVQYHPQHLVMEELFFGKNVTTALAVAEVRGLVLATALRQDMSLSQYSPATIKLAVAGAGNAAKPAVRKMLLLQLETADQQVLGSRPLDDAVDAVAVLFTHLVSATWRV